jgi:ATP-binding cassette subfamily B protein
MQMDVTCDVSEDSPQYATLPDTDRDQETLAILRRVFVDFATKNPLLTTASVAFVVLIPVQDVILPHLVGRLINSLRGAGAGGGFRAGGGAGAKSMLTGPAVVFISAVVVLQLLHVMSDLVDARLYPRVMNFVRQRMLACMVHSRDDGVSMTTDESNNGDLITRVSKVPFTVTFWFESMKSLIPQVLVLLAGAVYLALTVDPGVGAAVMAGVLIVLGILAYKMGSCACVSFQRDRAFNAVHERIDDTLRNMSAVLSRMTQRREFEEVARVEARLEELHYRTMACAVGTKAVTVPFAVGMLAAVIVVGRRRVVQGRLSTGMLVSAVIVAMYTMNALMRITDHLKALVYHWGVVRSSAPLLEACSRRRGAAVGLQPTEEPTVRWGFGVVDVTSDSMPRPVTFRVGRGERVALMGPIGSGKSTILKLLARLVEPTSGHVHVDGVSYSRLSVSDVRARFAYVPQTATLFNMTVLENVKYGNPEGYGIEQVRERAVELGLWEALESIGLGTPAGKGGSQISGGQRQVVWLVRAALVPGRVLLLDEPTASLDDASSGLISRALIRSRCTCVVATHDGPFARSFSTRIVRLG